MPLYCYINTCKYFTGTKTSDNVKVFRAPSDPAMREKWMNEIKKHQHISPKFNVCQFHFEDKLLLFYDQKKNGRIVKLRPDAIPTIFKPNPTADVSHAEVKVELSPDPPLFNGFPRIQSYSRIKNESIPQETQRIQPTEPPEDGLAVSSKICHGCLKEKVQIQKLQDEINLLKSAYTERGEIIKNLRSELTDIKKKYTKLVNKICPVCRTSYAANDERNHICNGNNEISCDYCERSFTSILDLVEHLDDDHAEKRFCDCDKCPQIFSMPILLQFHAKCHPIGDSLYLCEICNEKCYTKYQLNKHFDELHKEQAKNGEFKPNECGFCGKCLPTSQGLRMHMIHRHDKLPSKSFECFLCKLKLKSLRETQVHLRNHERKEKCVVCNEKCTALELKSHICIGITKSMNCAYCPQTCKTMKDLLQHLKNCKSEKLIYRCDFCPMLFMMESLKDIHMKHHGELARAYSCDICYKSFANRISLQKHKWRSHNAIRNHLCEECGKGFISARNLELHKRVHREKTIKCPNCDAKFTNTSNLKTHMERHQNMKFVCNICGALLVTSRGLREHKKIHTRNEADRKFACTLCPQKFFTSDRLRSHIRLKHNAGERFECEFCGDTYKYNGDLTKHKRLMHLGDDLYECPTCPKRFRLPYELERHKFEHYVPSESGQQK